MSYARRHSTNVCPGNRVRYTETGTDIGIVSLDGSETIEWLLQGKSNEGKPDVSPAGRWMAYTTDESGQDEVFVVPFPNVGDGRWKISRDGGFTPQWGPDGGELFFQTSEGGIMMAAIITEPTFSHEPPVRLFDGPYFVGASPRPRAFDISPDGQRLLMIKEDSPSDTASAQRDIIVITNWFEELKRLVPTDE